MLRNCSRARHALSKASCFSSWRKNARSRISGKNSLTTSLLVGGAAVATIGVKERDDESFESGFRHMWDGSVQVDKLTFCQTGRRMIQSTETEFTFSPTLKFACFTITEGFNEQGSSLAERLSKLLPEAVCSWLADLYSAAANVEPLSMRRNPGELPNPVVAPSLINETIQKAFQDVDENVVISEPDATSTATATTGCSALMGIFSTDDRWLRVALTGEGHAVLGRRKTGHDGRYLYEAEILTTDQVATNPEEAARLTKAHPCEPDMLKDGHLLGWKQTRAFGVGAMKWSREVLQRMHNDFQIDGPRDDYLTPPYFTAIPTVTQTASQIQPGDFAIFGTGGFWSLIRDEEAIGLVGLWIKQNAKNSTTTHQSCHKTYTLADLPVHHHKDTPTEGKHAFKCLETNPAAHITSNLFETNASASDCP